MSNCAIKPCSQQEIYKKLSSIEITISTGNEGRFFSFQLSTTAFANFATRCAENKPDF